MPVTPSRGRRRRSRGQSLVELALIAPVFLILLLTAIDLGRLMYSQITITNAAKEGALVASQG
ncbi:MAG TPA: TadE family protein, partial [Candidatus Limnocylindrales bacterium]|nr:TadE family protein [Candidatus Limnocylindrales bacterium]